MNAQNLRKAAVLISSLDETTADSLIVQMTDEQAIAVREAVWDLGPVTAEEREAVIAEFFRIGPFNNAARSPGVSLETNPGSADDDFAGEAPAERFAAPHEAYARSGSVDRLPHAKMPTSAHSSSPIRGHQSSLAGPFSFLHDVDLGVITSLLDKEHPQAIALVVSHLPPAQAAEVLAELGPTLQVDVIRRLADIDDTAPEIVQEVERCLEASLLDHLSRTRRRATGATTVASILEAADSLTKHKILRNMTGKRRSTGEAPATPAPFLAPAAESYEPLPRFTFDDVIACDDQALASILQSANPRLIVLALAGSPSEFLARVYRKVPPGDAAWLRAELAQLGPTRLADVEHAQQELAALAESLAAEERVSAEPARHLSFAA